MHENDVNPDIGWPKSPTAIEQAKLAMKDSPAYPVKAAVLLLLLAIICYTGGASDPTPAVPVAGGAQPKPTGSAASQVAAKARSEMVANRGAESRSRQRRWSSNRSIKSGHDLPFWNRSGDALVAGMRLTRQNTASRVDL